MEVKNRYQMFNVTEPFIIPLAHGLKQSGYVQLHSYISTDEHQLASETSLNNRRPVDFSSCLHYLLIKLMDENRTVLFNCNVPACKITSDL